MVTLESVNTEMSKIFESFDTIVTKADIFIESSLDEYNLNLKESNLKVMQEDGTAEDLMYLEGAAEESFKDRALKTIIALKDRFMEFIKRTITNIRNFFAKDTTEKALAKIEEATKKHPEIKGIKVDMRDPKKLGKEFDGERSKLQKLMAKFKTGNANASDKKELEKIEGNLKDRGASIVKRVAIGAVTVAAAVAAVKFIKDHLCNDRYNDGINCTKKSDFDRMDAETVQYASRTANRFWDSWRFKVTNLWEICTETLTKIKNAIKDKLSGVVAKESSSDERIRDIYSQLYMEGKKDDDECEDCDDSECDGDDCKDKKDKDDSEGDTEDKKSSKKKDDEPEEEEPEEDSDDDDNDDSDKKKSKSKKKKDDDDDDDAEPTEEKPEEGAETDGETTEESSEFGSFFDDEYIDESESTDDLDGMFDRFFGESSEDATAQDLFDQMDTNFFEE